jgi:ribonuclease-3
VERQPEVNTIGALEKRIGHSFKDISLLYQALTHRSYGKDNNERLEYLGDSILGFLVAEALYNRFPTQTEGVLTRLRASLVNKATLAVLARNLGLGDHLQLGTGEKKSGGWRRDSILANAFEAVIGAIYLDSGMSACRHFVLTAYRESFANLDVSNLEKDPKTELQEYLQAAKQPLPVYSVVSEEGEAHARKFTVACRIDGIPQIISASGKSKRIAEQMAARKALDYLRDAG